MLVPNRVAINQLSNCAPATGTVQNQIKRNAVQKLLQKDAYALLLEAIDSGTFKPGDRLVESDLAERFGMS